MHLKFRIGVGLALHFEQACINVPYFKESGLRTSDWGGGAGLLTHIYGSRQSGDHKGWMRCRGRTQLVAGRRNEEVLSEHNKIKLKIKLP